MDWRPKVQYVVNDKGRRTAVLMSYRQYCRLMEDLDDLSVKLERRYEPAQNFGEVVAELKKEGRL